MNEPTRSAAERDVALVWLVGWMLCIVMATLYPFDFAHIAKEPRLGFFGRSLRLDDSVDVAQNLLLFLPVGAVLSHIGRRRSVSGRQVLWWSGVVALLVSGAIEDLQRYLPLRDSSVTDILSNVAGAVAGALAHQRSGTEASRPRLSASGTLLTVSVAAFTFTALCVSAALQMRTRLSNWDVNYPLLMGNEATGDRPWHGRLISFELTDAATPPVALRRLASGGPFRAAGTRVASVNLLAGAPYQDTSGRVPDFDWTERTEGRWTGGTLPGRPWLRTRGPASDVGRRLRETSAFTLRLLCATDDIRQKGPARILSYSVDKNYRNFTLGQQEADLVFRLRTPHTGPNGVQPEARVARVFADTQLRDIVLTYDGATLRASVTGLGFVYRLDLTPGSSFARFYEHVRPQALQEQSLEYLAVLFVVPGVLVGVLGQRGLGGVGLAGVWVLAFSVLLEGTLVLASGKWFEWSDVWITAAVGSTVLTLVGGTIRTITPQHCPSDL